MTITPAPTPVNSQPVLLNGQNRRGMNCGFGASRRSHFGRATGRRHWPANNENPHRNQDFGEPRQPNHGFRRQQ